MTNYTAPPNQTDLVLQSLDILNVFGGGTATGTIVNQNSVENVNPGGKALSTIVNGGVLNILDTGIGTTINSGNENVAGTATVTNTTINGGGELLNASTTAFSTIINAGGQQVFGTAIGTIVNKGGVQSVSGTAKGTIINGGLESVSSDGLADGIIFVGSHSTLALADPMGLTGLISNWQVGDVIDFLSTTVTNVTQTGNELTVTYGDHQTASYLLAGQQPNTHFSLHGDDHGGTNLILTLPALPSPSGDPKSLIESLYVGYFGRAGDTEGLKYWQDQLSAGHNSAAALAEIATHFSEQVEAKAIYPLLIDPNLASQAQIKAFITSIYENLFEREPDADGAAYWQHQLEATRDNPQAVGNFILDVISGAQAQDAVTLVNKTKVAALFSEQLGAVHLAYDADAAAIAHEAVDSVTFDLLTVSEAASVVSAFIEEHTLATYTAPPSRFDLVLNHGEILSISAGGTAVGTTINDGGVENVFHQGLSNYAIINSGGIENILDGGSSHGTTVARGGVENVYGRSIETEIDAGGVEYVYNGGRSIRPHIDGGVEHVFAGGLAQDVFFDGPNSTLELATPMGLTGAIIHWRVGDVIDLLNIKLTDLHESAGALTVAYEGQSATYALVDQQAGTFIHAVSDGNGGTNLILTPIIGVAAEEPGYLGVF